MIPGDLCSRMFLPRTFTWLWRGGWSTHVGTLRVANLAHTFPNTPVLPLFSYSLSQLAAYYFPGSCYGFSHQQKAYVPISVGGSQLAPRFLCCCEDSTNNRLPLSVHQSYQENQDSPLCTSRDDSRIFSFWGSLTHDRRWSGTLFISTTMINLVQTIRIYVSIVCPEHNRTCWKLW